MHPTLTPAAALAALMLASCATAPEARWPALLQPANDERLTRVVPARGVQIYACRPGRDGAAPAWTFVAPEALLFDTAGRLVGTHGAGPRWQASDGSGLVGKLGVRADAPRPDAIPWLALAATPEGPRGAFSSVTSIRRVNTEGGLAPTAGCDTDALGHMARIDYTADYYFYARRP